MKTRTIPLVAFLTAVVMMGVPSADAYSGTLQADIPFDFVIKGRELPKGAYEILLRPSGLMRFQSTEHNDSAMVFTVGLGANVTLDEGQLVFLSSGDTHVLTEVWQPGQGNGRALLPSFEVRTHERYERTAIVLRAETDNRSG